MLAIGASIYENKEDKLAAAQVVKDATINGADTVLFGIGPLQGIRRILSGGSPSEGLYDTLIDVPLQFVPTSSGQLARTIDPTKRQISDKSRFTDLLKSRTPFLSKTLPPSVSATGEIQKYEGGWFGQYLNPSIERSYKPTEADKEILRVYNAVEEIEVIPGTAPDAITVNGTPIPLAPTAKNYYQYVAAQEYYRLVNDAMRDPNYKAKSDIEKSKQLKQAQSDARDYARYWTLQRAGITE